MEYRSFDIDGPLEVIPRRIGDERGYFAETFRLNEFEARSVPVQFVQENQSLSVRPGTIRGLHFQSAPAAQGKLVRCIAGRLFDVAVDLRRGSPTFGRWISLVLSPDQLNQLWVPAGFAHGFCTLEPDTVISYRVTDYYNPEHDRGMAWNDPQVGVEWPEVADPQTLSARDGRLPWLVDLPPYFSLDATCA